MTKIYVGTSGWMYDWNIGGTLEWYTKHSGLNAVELNASFYRFPYPNQVKSWARKGSKLRWSVKTNQSITHYRQLSETSYSLWKKFRNLFSPMEDLIDYYLLQLPPRFTCTTKNLEKLENFIAYTNIPERIAVEFRNNSCFTQDVVDHAHQVGYTMVSIDAPLGRWIVKSNRSIYLRLHGSSEWYAHDYSETELIEIGRKSLSLEPDRLYIFFNNNHWMLENARLMITILREEKSSEYG
jgi:uncharacterized protein YecE (DUF72 family)